MGPTAVVPSSHYLSNDGFGLTALDQPEGWCHLGGNDPNDPTALAAGLAEKKLTAPLRVGSVCFMRESLVAAVSTLLAPPHC